MREETLHTTVGGTVSTSGPSQVNGMQPDHSGVVRAANADVGGNTSTAGSLPWVGARSGLKVGQQFQGYTLDPTSLSRRHEIAPIRG